MAQVHAASIPLVDLLPSPTNVRRRLTDIAELAQNIRAHGILQPLVAVPAPNGKFRIIAGHRRRAAAEKVGLRSVPCMVRTAGRSEDTALMISENFQRVDLDPIDLARAVGDLLERHSLAEVARMLGMSTATVRARAALLDLPEEAQNMVSERTLSLGDAVALVKQMRTAPKATARAGAQPGSRRSVGHFDSKHRLAEHVQAACTHADTDRRLLGPGCGPCWEEVIRADARGALDNVVVLPTPAPAPPPYDEAVVQRIVSRDAEGLRTARGDRIEAVRRLAAQGLSDAQISDHIGQTSRTVLRMRNEFGIAAAIARVGGSGEDSQAAYG